MTRTFSPDQRELLYVLAKGKCQICSIALGPDFHADHIKPWSRGGKTVIENGQALCPECNLSKGAKTMLNAEDYTSIADRAWQQEGMREIFAKIEGGQREHLCVACPGAGKTRFAVAITKGLMDAGLIDYVVVMGPKCTIRDNWTNDFRSLAELNVPSVTSAKLRQQHLNTMRTYDGVSATYASNARGYAGLAELVNNRKTLVILDEIHWARSTEKDPQSFGLAVEEAFKSADQVLTLSGTPWRSDRCRIPFVQYDMDGEVNADAKCTYADAIVTDVCRRIIYRRIDGILSFYDGRNYFAGQLEEETPATSMINGMYYCANRATGSRFLRAATDPTISMGLELITQAARKLDQIREYHPAAAGMVVARGQAEADAYATLMREKLGIDPVVVHSNNGSTQSDIAGFRDSEAPWIVSVNMITEGTDVPRLRVIANLHITMTPMFFRQLSGRAVRYESHLKGKQTAYMYMPAYGPLHAMAKDIEKEISCAIKEDDEGGDEVICLACGEPRPECTCERIVWPPPPERVFEALYSEEETMVGSTISGEEFEEVDQDVADTLEADSKIRARYSNEDIVRFARMSRDPHFIDLFASHTDDDLKEKIREARAKS